MYNELLFVVDEQDNPRPPRTYQDVLADGLWRRAGGGAIIDLERRKVLCQKRSDTLPERPGLWIALFGGKSSPNETPLQTAQRELHEELGVSVEETEFSFYKKYKASARKQFEYVYVLAWKGQLSEIKFDPHEVSKVAWVDISRAAELLEHDPGWYSYGYDIALLESLQTQADN